MNEEEKSYIAFVSYRHAEVDTAVARDVQRGLERFHVPRALRDKGAPARLAPVFRDKEELPVSAALGDDITDALARSGALVVVCSPRTQESTWVQREIETFLQTHDRSHVYTVLAEGDPSEVIPPQLLSETIDGVEHSLEPLSCDFRSTRREDRRAELVRLAAAILDVSYDSLMKRDRRRRTRIAAVAACTALAVAAGIAGFALWSNARIQEHYNEAMANHARLLVTEAQQQLEGGDRLAAIELATASVQQGDERRPVSPETVHVLQQATGAYERVAGTQFVGSLRMVARRALGQGAYYLCSSPNGAYVGALGKHGLVRVWDAQTLEQLFETQLPGNVSDGLALTDDGRVVASCWTSVSCWDLHSKELCWEADVEKLTGASFGDTSHLVLAPDQAHVYALGLKLACSIDVLTGACASKVDYGFGPGKYSSGVGGNSTTDEYYYDCVDNACAVSMTIRDDETGGYYDELCVLDFASGTCTVLPTRYGKIRGIRMLDRASAVVSYADGNSGEDRLRYGNGLISQKQYLRHVARKDLNTDETAWQADVSLWQPARYESLQPIANPSASFVGEGNVRPVLAYCVANVCEVLDLDTGASLSHCEVPQPFVMAWPSVSDDGVAGMLSCEDKGRTCTISFKSGKCVSLDNQCVDAEAGIRVGERTILATSEGVLYVYEEPKKDDAITTLVQTSASNAIQTQYGTLFFSTAVRELETGQKVIRLCMVDSVDKRVMWERTIASDGTGSLGVKAYDEGCAELYVASEKDGGGVEMTTVNMKTGETQQWQATSRDARSWESVAYVPIVGTSRNRIVGDRVYIDGRFGVAVTDLHERKTSMVWVDSLGNDLGYTGEVQFSPDRNLMLVPLVTLGNVDPNLTQYALMTDSGEVVRRLERPINYNVPLAWSDDGSRFVAVCGDAVVAFDTKGNEVFSAPLDGRVVLGLHLMGDRLLAACNEQGSKVLMSYALDGTGAMLHTTLGVGEGSTGKSLTSAVQWIPAGRGQDSTRDPGDLCVVFPSDNDVYLIDTATLSVCQDLSGCYGYDARSGCFIVRTYDVAGTEQEPYIGLFERYTVDGLTARGADQVGTSNLTDVQRAEFGI